MQDEEFIEDFLKEVRSYQPKLPPPFLLEMVAYEASTENGDKWRIDCHWAFRQSVLYALHKSFSLDDRAFIRFLLEQEIVYHRWLWAFSHTMHLCSFLLFILAEVEDVQLLWRAKKTSFDTWCGVDIQLLVGAGIPVTLAYLQRANEPWSQEARKFIEECQKGGEFGDLDEYKKGWNAEFRQRASLKRPPFL